MLRGVVVELSVETACNSIELLMSCAMVLAVGWVIRPVKTVGRITYIVLAQT